LAVSSRVWMWECQDEVGTQANHSGTTLCLKSEKKKQKIIMNRRKWKKSKYSIC
jgi:hypothetical protein